MNTSRVDSQRRIVLPNAQPGDVFEIQQRSEDLYLLVRIEQPVRLSRAECLAAMNEAPLSPSRPWEELRELTREP